MNLKNVFIILAHAALGWALCGAIMWIGMAITSMELTLIAHAVGAPVIFGLLSLNYFKRFNYTSPVLTAAVFTGFVILSDFFIVALLIEKSFEMFTSLLGTWIPFLLIFTSTYLTGRLIRTSD
jgi:hypothetical protein